MYKSKMHNTFKFGTKVMDVQSITYRGCKLAELETRG
jgi:hypothetical protein